MKPTPLYRNILISEEIDSSSVKVAINKIMDINYDDDLKEQDYKDWTREPIMLFINSNGGNAYDAFALADIIKTSKTPIYTIAIGWCMSGGLLIFMAGKKRFVGENATLMFHDVTGWVNDKTEGIKQELEESKRLSKMYCNIITHNSLVKQEILDDYITRKAEWFISAEEAINLKIANEYYK